MAVRRTRQAPPRIKKNEDPAVPRPEPVQVDPPQSDPPQDDRSTLERVVGGGLLGGAVERQLQQESDIKEIQRIQRLGRNR